MDDKKLFNNQLLRDYLINIEQKALISINQLEQDRLLNTKDDDLVEYYFGEFKTEPIILYEDKISVRDLEARIDVSQDRNRDIPNRSQPFYLDGTRISFFIPFEGDKNLFYCRPSSYNPNIPHATIGNNEIQISYEITKHDSEQVRARFDSDFGNIKNYLDWIETEIAIFNTNFLINLRNRAVKRRQKILKDRGLVESLGFQIKKRDDAPLTYLAPIKRKRINLLSPTSSTAYSPEPELVNDEYENILKILSNMVIAMERSPQAFYGMKEENLRSLFLVQLNSLYEGQASGETFNYQGKTDILIRVCDKNIFIAECKFWKGEKVLLDTCDQLLGYLTWRDTKTAILIFNRNRNFTAVVSSIPEIMRKHPNYKKTVEINDTTSKYKFHQREDPNRELLISVMAFDVPGKE